MKEIYIDTYSGSFYPCDVLWLRRNPITGNYLLYFFDRIASEYCYAKLTKLNGHYYVKDIYSQNDKHILQILAQNSIPKVEVADLPPLLKNINHRRITSNDVLIDSPNAPHAFTLIKKSDYIELKSYSNAIKGPEYLYFKVLDIKPFETGFSYQLQFSEKSKTPLKKNIIARHTTGKGLTDLFCDNGIYIYIYDQRDKEIIDPKSERIFCQNVMASNKDKKYDPEILTKVCREMLKEEDYLKALMQYQEYINTFYRKFEEQKYRNR